MKTLLAAIKRWLFNTTRQQTQQLVGLANAIDQSLALGDLVKAENRCAALARFLKSMAEDPASAETRRLLGAGYFDLGGAYRNLRRVPEAEAAYREATRFLESLLEVRNYAHFAANQIAACKNHLGLLYMDCGPGEKAVAAVEEAITMRRRLAAEHPEDGENRVYLGGALCNRAHLARESGATAAARALYDESIQVLEEAIPPCACGCRDAIATAVSEFAGHPHWIMIAHQFRRNAEEGKRLLTGAGPAEATDPRGPAADGEDTAADG